MTFGSLVDWWTKRPQNPPSARPMAPRFPQNVRAKINSHHPPPVGAWTMVGSSVIIGVNTSLYHLLWLLTLALRSRISSKSFACSLQMPKQIERMPDFANMHCNPPHVDIEPPHTPANAAPWNKHTLAMMNFVSGRHNGACSRLEDKVFYDSRRSFSGKYWFNWVKAHTHSSRQILARVQTLQQKMCANNIKVCQSSKLPPIEFMATTRTAPPSASVAVQNFGNTPQHVSTHGSYTHSIS